MRNVLPIALGAALLVAFSGSALAAGDAAKGAELFKATCGICHQIGPDAKTLVGPELNGIVGRKAAAIANYPMYSDGMKTLGELGVVWTEGNIDRWIANPKTMLPDSSMSLFPGVPNASDRADIIAYLKTFPPQ
jgi:cytochrome c